MDYIEVTGKTVDDAITNALIQLETTSDKIEYEVIEKGSNGFLGLIGKQDAVIKVRKKSNLLDDTYEFLNKLFAAMNMEVKSEIDYNEENRTMNIDFSGDEMGILIGKRGQTLDSLQYLISLVVNKESDAYIKVKVDTEDYRERRKQTLENLAKNLSYKVKRTRRPVTLEPMNPYERRIIHSALQNDRYVDTHSEGDEPYRKVVITLKRRENREYRKDYNRNYKEKND
ncbi:RNA-binding cell elongation regulator Jag/EloR [Frisingicoccus sp.]|uniref:RNA-binding cell elongation regulator Jag/EloR n=1 Tax=Frisingicoccus sp. TaxID=1918627 RepID=UPI0015ABB36F